MLGRGRTYCSSHPVSIPNKVPEVLSNRSLTGRVNSLGGCGLPFATTLSWFGPLSLRRQHRYLLQNKELTPLQGPYDIGVMVLIACADILADRSFVAFIAHAIEDAYIYSRDEIDSKTLREYKDSK